MYFIFLLTFLKHTISLFNKKIILLIAIFILCAKSYILGFNNTNIR